MTEFEIINRYKHLAARDAALPLLCKTCAHDLVVRLGKDDVPLLKCYTCGVSSTVGLQMISMMKHAIELYDKRRV